MTGGREVNVVLLGAPGAGKGTQAKFAAERLGLVHLATGDLFRDNLKRATPLGQQAKSYMDQGLLVPDEITVNMTRQRMEELADARGFIFDGFPRTLEQAKALDKLMDELGKRVDRVAYIKVSPEALMERLSMRWICRQCQAPYHEKTNPPKVAGKCDHCGGELYQRDDDRPETVRKRLEVYFAQTEPLIEYYRKQGVLREIDGEASIEAVTESLLAALK